MKTLFFKRAILALAFAGLALSGQLDAMKRKFNKIEAINKKEQKLKRMQERIKKQQLKDKELSKKLQEKKSQREEESVITIEMRKGLLTLLTGIEGAEEEVDHDKILKYSDIIAEENQIINKDDFYSGWMKQDFDEISMKDYHAWYSSKTWFFANVLTSFRKAQYKKMLTTWGVSTRYEKNLLEQKFCITFTSDDKIFGIADEMGSFIGFNNIAKKTLEEREREKPVEVTKNTTPKLWALVEEIAQRYNISAPKIFITYEFFPYINANGLYLSIYESIFCTNNEVRDTITHELAHIYLKNHPEEINAKQIIGISNDDINFFSRIHERAADMMAFEITECPQAMLTYHLKYTIIENFFGLVAISQIVEHPSSHERMVFAHSYLKGNIQSNIFKDTERQDPVSMRDCVIS